MKKYPKLLIFGYKLPGSRDGGGFVKEEILKEYPKEKYICFAVNPYDPDNPSDELPSSLRNIPFMIGPLVLRMKFRGSRFFMPFIRAIGFYIIAPWRVRQMVKFGRKHKVDLIWAELYGDAVLLPKKVSKKLGIPFVGTVWDDPEGWLQDFGYDRFSIWLLRRRFRQALQSARNISTAGEAMQRVYEDEYGVKSVILRHGFKEFYPSKKIRKNDKRIVIGFVGSAYGRDAWTAFLEAVAVMNASGKYPELCIKIFGSNQFPYRKEGVKIISRGWQPSDVMLEELSETDFCYLPYWFNPKKRKHAELSFPNKFETYMAAGCPVIFHGPEYAGITETIGKYGVGLCLHSKDEDQIVSAIKEMIEDRALRKKFERSVGDAFYAEFNHDMMMMNFNRLIGIAPSFSL